MLRRFADLAVDSDVPFPDLPCADGPADITIRRSALTARAWTRVQAWPGDDRDWLTIDSGGGVYRLTFDGLRCDVSGNGSRIEADAASPLGPAALAHLLLHQVLPLAVSRRGRTVLHACAVETPRGTVGLLGGSGAGKSTLAAALTARGAALVADDALVVDLSGLDACVWPTADGLRLWDDVAELLPSVMTAGGAAGEKRRVSATLCTTRTPLVRLVLVGDTIDEGATVSQVPRGEARMALLSHLFRLDVGDAEESRRLFDEVHRLVSVVPARRLAFASGPSALDAAAAAVLRDLDET